ncbi:DNA-directed RNA polymerase V subunit 1-like [Rutidosis leptorrhynchoides]|uniref:DNA-directed RNA polymerase V subunit 1-like n=1 Tax=Rutidosis leptorrhynchoides TaxID=125765 RepID=UPI003A98F071
MEENSPPSILEGKITGISFSLATRQEICLSSISDCPINHASQLTNPFLGLPLEVGKCESCGTAEPGKCEGHFGYIELPAPIYHPSHLTELKRILSLICLKCLKFKNRRLQSKHAGVLERAFAVCCDEAADVTVHEDKTQEGAVYLMLKHPSRSRVRDGFWDFLDRYGYRYGDGNSRPLLPSEVLAMLKKIPEATKKKLAARGVFIQEGYIMQHLPVPPNCLSTPDISDGITVSASDISMPMLKKVLRQVEIIKSSRSGRANFESLEVEVNDLQLSVAQYLQSRGAKATPDRGTRYGIAKSLTESSSTKAWLEKMKTLFISKGSGFSSRSVITGDAYKGVDEIGIPYEIAQRITFEERVTEYNMQFLQKLVDEKLCLTYRDGQSTYSLREGSKGHTFLKPGQIVHRKIMEGDVIFINRPPTTHKHSLQALSVYIHDDHTIKINPIICGPLGADFDGDCIHIFYPQSPEAKAEVLELFAVEKQLLSSHNGNVNLQLGTDAMLSLKTLFQKYFFNKAQVQQLALFTSNALPKPSLLKVRSRGPFWTVLELLETSLPRGFNCSGDRFLIRDSKFLKFDYGRDVIQSVVNEVISSIFFTQGPKEVLKLFNALQPMLMESLSTEGFNLSLEDFVVPQTVLDDIEAELQNFSSLLYHLRLTYNEVIAMQLDKQLRDVKNPIADFIVRFSSMGNLVDTKSESALTRIVQQIGFLGLEILERGRLYSRTLTADLSAHFRSNYPFAEKYPYEEFGLVRSGLFHGLDPYQEMVHSIASREVMIRSSRGLTEPGILFKNSMAILRDVVICYDGTVRNVCSNSIIQFEYGGITQNLFAAGEPVGVLAATAMSNPAYKAVLDSSPNSNSTWNMMKEILTCGVNFKNVVNDRRVVLYLNYCDCGAKYCVENAAFLVKNHLRKVSLKDVALEFLIEYKRQEVISEIADTDAGLVGHIHLNKTLLKESNISMEQVLAKCEDTLNAYRKKKKGVGLLFKRIAVSFSECSFQPSSESKWTPCLKFYFQDTPDLHLEKTAHIYADTVCPVLLNTIVKGDPRVQEANITWISPSTSAWIRNSSKDHQKGELAIDVILEKEAVKKSGDAWRTVMDSCLPVIHLIDTTRSIPYAIKQVEDLLGIACAFEQAVQRLSTSVSMVSKGMLKEHLLLVANSMTSAGILVGFNQAGIKALSKTLNFQVPFSEATVYTPKKCFEKAAEKCHSDSLSSIVGACSWGKPVAVGTGSRFDILWDTREVKLNPKEGIDVYNFLHLTSGGFGQADSACLGDVDSFDFEDNYMEMGSPETESKPVFEDGLELNLDAEENGQSGWATGSAPEDGGGWGSAVKTTPAADGGWGSAVKTTPTTDDGGWGSAVKTTPAASGGWGATKPQEESEPSGWGAKKSETETEKGGSGWGVSKSYQGGQQTESSSGGWGAATNAQKAVQPSAWGAKNTENETETAGGSGWGAPKSAQDQQTVQSAGGWGASKSQKEVEPSGWGAKKIGNDTDKAAGGSWGAKSTEGQMTGSWGAPKSNESQMTGGWGASKSTESQSTGGWGASNSKKEVEPSGWGEKKTENEAVGGGWGSSKSKMVKPDEPAWGAKKSDNDTENGSGSGSWGAPKSGGWGTTQVETSGAWGKAATAKTDAPSWNTGVDPTGDLGEKKSEGADWSKKLEEKTEEKGGWGAWGKKKDEGGPTTDGSSEKPQEETGGWNQKGEQKADQGGWKKKEGWGPKRDRPDRPVGRPNDGPRPVIPMTATRQRLDMFTSDELEILSDIEPIMLSTRRIMHQPGYTDGDPLPADDQTYIKENILPHHPEKAQKMGAGIDYIMVSEHEIHKGSRCFFVVSTDGRKEDFSSIKCLKNYVKEKYPEKADEFNEKYFRKREPRPPMNRQDSGTPRSQTGGWKRDDESGTPWSQSGWKHDDESGTPRSQSGWKRDDESGAPRSQSGWNKESSEAPAEGQVQAAATGWNQAGSSGCAGADEGKMVASGWNKEASEAPAEGQVQAAATGWNQGGSSGGGGAAADEGKPVVSGWNKEASEAPAEGQVQAAASGWNQAGSSGGAAKDGGSSQKSGWGS